MIPTESHSPMTSVNIPMLVEECAKIRAALARVDEARKAAQESASFLFGLLKGSCMWESMGGNVDFACGLELEVDRYRYSRTGNTNENALKAVCWAIALERSQLWQSMDRQTREKWSDAIREMKCVDFTPETVTPTLAAIRDSRGDMFTAGLLQAFRGLSWCYKSNSPLKLESRQVISYALERYAGYPRISHRTESTLDDLYRIFCALDGKPEPTREASISRMANEYWREHRACEEYDGDPYLRLVPFKNGNLHIWHKRQDLLDKANRLMGEAQPFAIPAASRKTR